MPSEPANQIWLDSSQQVGNHYKLGIFMNLKVE